MHRKENAALGRRFSWRPARRDRCATARYSHGAEKARVRGWPHCERL